MAPDPQNASSPPARRTLADLPPELKGIIARMAREQDSAFQQRMKGLELQCDTVRLGKSDWHGRSAHALFLVDRAWNMAVTPMLFETIDSNRCKEKIFGFQIARKHARFVKRVHFCQEAREEEEDWESLLRATPSFVNLEHVTFAYEASNALFNAEGHPDDDQAAYREALQSVAPSVRSLRIEEPCPGVVRWMLPMFVNLRRFEWTIFFEDSDQPGCLALKAMARCSTLEHLTLLGETEELFEEYVEEEETKARSWPSLRSLTVGVSTHLGIEGWRFIRSFRETLERVTVDLHPTHDQSQRSRNEHLPLLTLFSASPIRHLDLFVLDDEIDGLLPAAPALFSTTLLETILRLFPVHLQSLKLNYLPLQTLHDLHLLAPTLHSLASARNVSLTLGPSYDVFLHRPRRNSDPPLAEVDNAPLHPQHFVKSREDVEEVLRFGSEQAAGLSLMEDVAGMERLIEVLEPLKEHMMRARD
ncbi:hypothetical protein BCR35DRAFT_355598 [Leucosporidium creatinivorum]|uniref:Uncharacterized protein n=1 Tax=Leucosporidium creatinivorum TaxID=106004 RepID=A0A1Y2DBA7_9BASI|nr:hypothetical protein BCR35DRAFT_355598 [Leucosporidium creatinivorum]